MTERKATFLDTIGPGSKQLFARHKETGERISARRFFSLPGDEYERDGYVLMTTARRRERQGGLFEDECDT